MSLGHETQFRAITESYMDKFAKKKKEKERERALPVTQNLQVNTLSQHYSYLIFIISTIIFI